jgi:hypothetical protein
MGAGGTIKNVDVICQKFAMEIQTFDILYLTITGIVECLLLYALWSATQLHSVRIRIFLISMVLVAMLQSLFEMLEWIPIKNLYVHWLETVFAVWMHTMLVLSVMELSILFSKLEKITRKQKLQKMQYFFVLVHFLIVLPIYGAPLITYIQPVESLQVVDRVPKIN